MKNLRNNFKNRFKNIIYNLTLFFLTLFCYSPINNFMIGFLKNGLYSTSLTTFVITLLYLIIAAFVFDPIKNIFNGNIVNANIEWKNDNPLYFIQSKYSDVSYCSISFELFIKPLRSTAFSICRFLGMGICLYNPSNSLRFSKDNGSNKSKKYSVLNNRRIFIRSFYKLTENDENKEEIWNIKFKAQILDDTLNKSNINFGIVIGTKNHKIDISKYLKRIMCLKGKYLTVINRKDD